VSALTLLDDFQRDKAAAETRYAGREIMVSGTIAATGRTKAGVPFVSFQRPGAHSPVNSMVVCNFDARAPRAATELKAGETIELRCRVRGVLTGNVMLENCQPQ
jgi:hypothetical protein